jgi:hypothetical protein
MLLASLLHLFLIEGRGREGNKQTKRRTIFFGGLGDCGELQNGGNQMSSKIGFGI